MFYDMIWYDTIVLLSWVYILWQLIAASFCWSLLSSARKNRGSFVLRRDFFPHLDSTSAHSRSRYVLTGVPSTNSRPGVRDVSQQHAEFEKMIEVLQSLSVFRLRIAYGGLFPFTFQNLIVTSTTPMWMGKMSWVIFQKTLYIKTSKTSPSRAISELRCK